MPRFFSCAVTAYPGSWFGMFLGCFYALVHFVPVLLLAGTLSLPAGYSKFVARPACLPVWPWRACRGFSGYLYGLPGCLARLIPRVGCFFQSSRTDLCRGFPATCAGRLAALRDCFRGSGVSSRVQGPAGVVVFPATCVGRLAALRDCF